MSDGWDSAEALDASSDLSGFHCGLASVDEWLQDSAKRSLGYVATTLLISGGTIVGFFALRTIIVKADTVSKRYEKYADDEGNLPGLLLCQMGVDVTRQGEGLGDEVFKAVLREATRIYESARIPLFLTDAATEKLVEFYVERGMTPTEPNSRRLIASMATVSRHAR